MTSLSTCKKKRICLVIIKNALEIGVIKNYNIMNIVYHKVQLHMEVLFVIIYLKHNYICE